MTSLKSSNQFPGVSRHCLNTTFLILNSFEMYPLFSYKLFNFYLLLATNFFHSTICFLTLCFMNATTFPGVFSVHLTLLMQLHHLKEWINLQTIFYSFLSPVWSWFSTPCPPFTWTCDNAVWVGIKWMLVIQSGSGIFFYFRICGWVCWPLCMSIRGSLWVFRSFASIWVLGPY